VIKKVLNWIINILTILVFIVLSLIIFAKINMMVSHKNYFQLFDYSIFKVATGSMASAINEGDIIIVKTQSDYKENDIITYSSADSFITHRITQISNGNYITKGDANNTSDPAIKKEVIIGKVVKIFSGLGIWQEILTQPTILALIFITLILFDFAFSYKGESDEKKKQIDKIDLFTLKGAQKEAPKDTKLTDDEIAILYEKIEEIKKAKNLKESNLDNKEKEFLDYTIGYTIRLDLNKVQKEIDSKINKK
jgi:signal peptidase I